MGFFVLGGVVARDPTKMARLARSPSHPLEVRQCVSLGIASALPAAQREPPTQYDYASY